jgi:hypothetical protein
MNLALKRYSGIECGDESGIEAVLHFSISNQECPAARPASCLGRQHSSHGFVTMSTAIRKCDVEWTVRGFEVVALSARAERR